MITYDLGTIFGWIKTFMVEMGIFSLFSVAINIVIVVTLTSYLFSILRRS